MIGKTVAHYRIIEEIGSGGMGVVYRAEDTRLKRTVALKFLPPELTRDADAKQRFIREAQAASALEHPAICNIHEINETEKGQSYIVMAFYKGLTLNQKLAAGPLPVDQAVNIAGQICRGLSRAHEQSIVHRDIKPANIFITDRDEVKILDFGLAKLAGQAQLTKDASTLGTIAYMSPEQCSGDEVDQRTDIWSLGVLFYQMLSGKLPFKGDYEQAIIYSILNEKPERISELRSGLPVELERIVHKAIDKNLEKRYLNADELLTDLLSLREEGIPRRVEKKPSLKIPKWLPRILPVVFILTILGVGYWVTRPRDTRVFQIKRTSPLTTAPGLEQDPAWSPEGTRIAYASDESGNMDIWVLQTAAGERVNLTQNNASYDGKPAWSPDGEWIAFVSERNGGGVFVMSALGGIPKQVVSLFIAVSVSRIGSIPDVSWSSDGSNLVYAVAGSLYTISSAGGIASPVNLPPAGLIVGYHEPAWSPGGDRIACTGFFAEGETTSQIWSLHSSENDPLPITEGKYLDHNPVWSVDGKHIFFISNRGGSPDVWWMAVDSRGKPTGPARPLTSGVGIGSIALSRDGTKLAFAKAIDRSNIYSIPILQNRLVALDEARIHTSGNHYIENLSISGDGQWIAFDSNRRGNMDIWIMRKDGSELRPLTSHPAHDWYPMWSPDGKYLLFHSMRSGNRDIFVMPVGGGAVTQLTDHLAEDLAAIWSPDGRKIAFSSNRSGNMNIWVMPGGGGESRQVTFEKTRDIAPFWSPDGRQILFSSNQTGNFELFLIPEESVQLPGAERKTEQLTHADWIYLDGTFCIRDRKTIYAYGVSRSYQQNVNLWAISAADGSARPLIDFQGSLKEPSHSVWSDGERIYFPLCERIGDLWMAELAADDR
jgi:Tol biopolymer transport system component